MKSSIDKKINKWMPVVLVCLAVGLISTEAFAKEDLGTFATHLTGTFKSLSKVVTAGSWMAGLAFAIGSILKFKQHKDNPTNIPIGTPVGLLLVAAALLFLPNVLNITGGSLFSSPTTAGPSGIIFSGQK